MSVQVSMRLPPKMASVIKEMAEDKEMSLNQMYAELVMVGFLELRRVQAEPLRAENFVSSPSYALDGNGDLERS